MDENTAIINIFQNLVDFLATAFGPRCEVVLHRIEKEASSIIAIKNGEITNRKIGEEREEVIKRVRQLETSQGFITHEVQRTAAGNEMKSNTFFIKNSGGELIGMLCINMDVGVPLAMLRYLEDFIPQFATREAEMDNETESELSDHSIEEYTVEIIRSVITGSNIPADRMTPDEKIEILKKMKDKGVFRIKGAVREIARQLETSEPTIYRYLKAIEQQ